MTYPDKKLELNKSDVPEFEITPAMVEAGLSALYEWDERTESDEHGMKSIFLAMWAARTQV